MHFSGDPFMIVVGVVNLALGLYVLGLWIYLLGQTGLKFCWFFVVAGAIGVVLGLIDVSLYYDPTLGIRLLGTAGWTVFFYAFVCVRLATYVMAVIGTTFLVTWTRKAHKSVG